MGSFYWTYTHAKGHRGDRGTDSMEFEVQEGEGFLSVVVALSGAVSVPARCGATVTEHPDFGAGGRQRVTVDWWFDGTLTGGPGRVRYGVHVFTGITGRIIVFEHRDFEGDYEVFDWAQSGSARFNDRISSLAVLRGHWSFYRDDNFKSPFQKNGKNIVVPPGLYPWVDDLGIANDSISSIQCVAEPPNL